jgi:pantothenate kinase
VHEHPIGARLLHRALNLRTGPRRSILGITGPPAAGKSTLADALVSAIGASAAYVPLDGFHLAHQLLSEIGLVDRKGAPETFDARGYVALLRRLLESGEDTIYAPRFYRHIEDPIANAIAVEPGVRLVITEGNYLLLESGPWQHIRSLLRETWYIDINDKLRLERLVARHVAYGRTFAEAEERALGSDQRNAELIAITKSRATLVVTHDCIVG